MKEKDKKLAKSASKKEKKEQIRNPVFHIIAYFSYCQKATGKTAA